MTALPSVLRSIKGLGLAIVLSLAPLAGACYNDRDTLGFELRNRPDVQRALTGRFERNPAQYYAMRVERLRAKPSLTAAEHDDLAVALDRQGKGEEALAAIEAKGKLPNLSEDDRYRFFANRGTIHAHHWLMQGAKAKDVAELKQAESDIAQAIRINPSAHFGREAIQLEVIRWMRSIKTDRANAVPLPAYLVKHLPKEIDETESLSGLIMLGAAWESPDIVLALAVDNLRRHRAIGNVAYLRFRELLDAGKKCLDPELASLAIERDVMPRVFEKDGTSEWQTDADMYAQGHFERLRKEADEWHSKRIAFMTARLKEGRHPDTDPKFWDGWVETDLPEVPDPSERLRQTKYWVAAFLGIVGLAVMGAGIKLGKVVYRRFRARNA